MSRHNIQTELRNAAFTATGKSHNTPAGFLYGWDTVDPVNGTAGFAKSAAFHSTANGNIYINVGSNTSASWRLSAPQYHVVDVPFERTDTDMFIALPYFNAL